MATTVLWQPMMAPTVSTSVVLLCIQDFAGAANDTIIITDDLKNSSVYAGAGADTFSGASATSSYLGGNKGADTIVLGGLTRSSIYGAGAAITTDDGSDSLTVAGEVSLSFVQGNGGNDTLDLNDEVDTSTVKGGAGVDLVEIGGIASASEIAGNKGNDTFLFSAQVNSSTVYGGSTADTTDDGSDSLAFVNEVSKSIVKANVGNDTIDFNQGTVDLKGSSVMAVLVMTSSTLQVQ